MSDLSYGRVSRLFRSAPVRKAVDVSDDELERMLTDLGMPADQQFSAYRVTIPRQYLMLRNLALGVYMDYRDAARGDGAARERIAVMRDMWNEMNKRRAREIAEAREKGEML